MWRGENDGARERVAGEGVKRHRNGMFHSPWRRAAVVAKSMNDNSSIPAKGVMTAKGLKFVFIHLRFLNKLRIELGIFSFSDI